MGRLLSRGHFREIGVEEDITMIFDHPHLHDYGVQARHGGNGGAVAPLAISRRALLGGIGGTLAAAMLSAKARAAGSPG